MRRDFAGIAPFHGGGGGGGFTETWLFLPEAASSGVQDYKLYRYNYTCARLHEPRSRLSEIMITAIFTATFAAAEWLRASTRNDKTINIYVSIKGFENLSRNHLRTHHTSTTKATCAIACSRQLAVQFNTRKTSRRYLYDILMAWEQVTRFAINSLLRCFFPRGTSEIRKK